MSVAVYIGDEVSAGGYRLAGLRALVPRAGDLQATLRAACEQASVVLISAQLVRHIPSDELDRLLAGVEPAVVIVPDITGHTPLPDLATRLRQQLGVLE